MQVCRILINQSVESVRLIRQTSGSAVVRHWQMQKNDNRPLMYEIPRSSYLHLRPATRDVKASRPTWPRGQNFRPLPRPHSIRPRPRSGPMQCWPRSHEGWPRGLVVSHRKHLIYVTLIVLWQEIVAYFIIFYWFEVNFRIDIFWLLHIFIFAYFLSLVAYFFVAIV